MSDQSALRDEIALREASIADARAEMEAGELTAEEFDSIVASDEAAIARAREALAAAEATNESREPAAPRPRRRHRRRYLVVALVCFALAAAGILVLALQPRQPGSSDTGGVSGSTSQQVRRLLAEAELDQAAGQTIAALAAYNTVLSIESANVEALTQSGWLYFSAGSARSDVALVRTGVSRLMQAVSVAPNDPDPRLYFAIAAASTPGSHQQALQQFKVFLALHPSRTELALAKPWLRQLGLAN